MRAANWTLGVLLFPIGAVYAQQPPPQVATAAASTSATTPAASSPAPSIPKSSAPAASPTSTGSVPSSAGSSALPAAPVDSLPQSTAPAQAPLVVSPEAAPSPASAPASAAAPAAAVPPAVPAPSPLSSSPLEPLVPEPKRSAGFSTVVSATRTQRDVFDTPMGTTVVGSAEIQRRPAASTAELLRDQPGIWTNGEGLVNTTVYLRGAVGNQTLLMIDGARINNAQIFSGPNQFFQSIDPESIDRIEVVRGAGSVLWGSDALGGMIQVFSRQPRDFTEQGVAMTGLARLTLGSADNLQRYRAEAGAATPRVRLSAGVTFSSVGDLSTPGALGILSPSSWSSRAIDGRVDFRLRQRDILTLSYQEQNVAGAQSYDISFTRPIVTDRERRLAQLRYESFSPFAGVRRLQAWAYVQQQQDYTRNQSDGSETSTKVLSLSADAQASSRPASALWLTYGLHLHGDIAQSVNSSAGVSRSRGFPDSTFVNAAGFVLAEARPAKKLSLLAGLRLDVMHLRSEPDDISAPKGLDPELLRVRDTNLAPTGSVGIVGHALPWMNLVLSAGRGFRAANISDQLSSGAFRNGYNYPSPGLSAESSWNLEGGVRLRVPGWLTASVTGFYTWYQNLIQQEARDPTLSTGDCVDINSNGRCDANEYIYVKRNQGQAYTGGLEADANVTLPYGLGVFLAGTYVQGRVTSTDQPFSTLPPPNLTLGARWAPKRFYLEAFVRMVSEVDASNIPCSRVATDGGLRADPRNINSALLGTLELSADKTMCSGAYPGYVTLGLRGGAKLTSFLDANLSVNNVTNASYRDKEARFDAAGVNAVGSITLHEPR